MIRKHDRPSDANDSGSDESTGEPDDLAAAPRVPLDVTLKGLQKHMTLC